MNKIEKIIAWFVTVATYVATANTLSKASKNANSFGSKLIAELTLNSFCSIATISALYFAASQVNTTTDDDDIIIGE